MFINNFVNFMSTPDVLQPNQILGSDKLKLWYAPDSFVSASAKWFNKANDGAENVDVTGPIASSSLKSDTNGQAIRIVGGSTLAAGMTAAYLPSGSQITTWWVGRHTDYTDFIYLWLFGGAQNGVYTSTNLLRYQWKAGLRVDKAGGTYLESGSFAAKATFNVGNGFYRAYYNNVLQGTGTDVALAANVSSLTFGRSGAVADIYINEFICAIDPTEEQIEQVDIYLNNKWGIY